MSEKLADQEKIADEIKKSIDDAIRLKHRPSIVIGLHNQHGEFYYAKGKKSIDAEQVIDSKTQFGIGSVTKLFTTTLMSKMVNEHEGLTIDTSAKDITDVTTSMVTLKELALHKGGLAKTIPVDVLQANVREQLLNLLPAKGVLKSQYSNIGMAVLGQLLSTYEQKTLDRLMQNYITKPWQLDSVSYLPEPQQLAHSHLNMQDISEQKINTPTVAYGAGGLYANAEDLLAFVVKHMQAGVADKDNWASALFGQNFSYETPLGWKHHDSRNGRVYYHGGDGNGYQAFVGFNPSKKVAVVLLTNSSADDDLQNLALAIFDEAVSVPDFSSNPVIPFDMEKFPPFIGQYHLVDEPNGNVITFAQENGQLLYIEETSSGELVRKTRLYSTHDHVLFMKELPIEINILGSHNISMSFGGEIYPLQRVKQ